MTYPTVTVGTNDYNVYADQDTADTYAAAALHATTWNAATDAQKAQALVTATRLLDRQLWAGEKSDEAQALQWPRDDTDIDDVTDGETPQGIIDGCIELAIALLDDTDIQSQSNTARKEQSISIGGAISVSYFRGAESASGASSPSRFPTIVQELVGRFMIGSTAALAVVTASGTTDENGDEPVSITQSDFTLNRGI